MSGVTPLEIVERAVTVLRNINAFDGVTVSELAKLSDVPRAAVNRYLVTWVNLGYVARDEVTRKYTVTPSVLQFSSGTQRDDWVTTHVRPHLIETCKEIGWPLSLSTIRNSRLNILESTDPESPMIIYPMREHLVLPLVGRSAGHVLLAYKAKEVRADILKSVLAADPYIFSRAKLNNDKFESVIRETRAQGFAITKVLGVNWATLSVPLKINGNVDFALSNRFHPTATALEDATDRFLEPLKACAQIIADALKSIRHA
jgi:DNA-binding IclR family transcriptional regulator